MSEPALIWIDLGKHNFHLHGQDTTGREVFHKKLSRPQMMVLFSNVPACTIVMEACAGAHFVRPAVGSRRRAAAPGATEREVIRTWASLTAVGRFAEGLGVKGGAVEL